MIKNAQPELFKDLVLVIVLFVGCFVVRAPLLDDRFAIFTGDEGIYDTLAQQILNGNGFTLADGTPTAWRAPGFPTVLAGIYAMVGPISSRARVVLIIISCLTAVATYTLSRALFNNRLAAFLAGIGWCVLLTSIRMADQLYGEETAAFLWLVGTWLAVKGNVRRSLPLVCLSGLVLGFAVLTRGFLLPALLATVLWYVFEKNTRYALAFLLMVSLVLGSWMVRNAVVMGSFTLSTQPKQEMWAGNNQWARGAWPGEWMLPNSQQRQYIRERHPGFFALSEVEQAKIFGAEARNEVLSHPRRILWLLPRKLFLYLSPTNYFGTDWVYLGVAPLAVFGMVRMLKDRAVFSKGLLLVVPFFGVGLVCLLTFGDSRFRHPLDPLLLIAAGFGVQWLIVAARKSKPTPVDGGGR